MLLLIVAVMQPLMVTVIKILQVKLAITTSINLKIPIAVVILITFHATICAFPSPAISPFCIE